MQFSPMSVGGASITDPNQQKKPGEQPPQGGGGNDDAEITPQSFGVPGGQGSKSTASAQPQTFAQMQAAGIPRPAPTPWINNPMNPFGIQTMQPSQPAPTPQPSPIQPTSTPAPGAPGAGGLGPQIMQVLQQWLGNPSQYGQEDFNNLVASGARQIDDQYALDKQAIDADMARRGILDSTIAGGKLNDLNIGKRNAMVELQDRANQFVSQKRSNDLASALGAAMGFDNADRAFGLDENSQWMQLLGLLGDQQFIG